VRKIIIAVAVASSFLFSGCAAVVQGGAALMAKNASDHPASKNFVVGMGKNDVFNAAMRALTAKDRKITSSDREAGIVQGEFDGNAVTIKIAGKGSREAVVDITVSYAQAFVYGDPKLEEKLDVLKAEIERAGAESKDASSSASGQKILDTPAAGSASVNAAKSVHKKVHAKVAAE